MQERGIHIVFYCERFSFHAIPGLAPAMELLVVIMIEVQNSTGYAA